MTGDCKGLQIESARTNLLLQSNNMSVSPWTTNSATGSVTPNALLSPDGTITANLLSDTDSTNIKYWDQIVSVPNNSATYAQSVYLKQGTAQSSALIIYILGGTTPLAADTYTEVNWSDMSVVSNCGGKVENVGGGWYRLDVQITNNNSGNTQLYTRVLPAGLLGGGSRSGNVYAWGNQSETGLFPSSYMPTTTAQVTRAADFAYLDGVNLTSWYRQTEGTVLIKGTLAARPSIVEQELFVLSDLTINNRVYAAVFSDGLLNTLAVSAGNQQYISQKSTTALPREFRCSVGIKSGEFASSFNGEAVQSNPSALIPATPVTQMTIGAFFNGIAQIDGWISQLSYYPKRLSNNQLQALSA